MRKWQNQRSGPTQTQRGNVGRLPAAKLGPGRRPWSTASPDLIVERSAITVKAPSTPGGASYDRAQDSLTGARYVASVEVREVDNFAKDGAGRGHRAGQRLQVAPPDLGDNTSSTGPAIRLTHQLPTTPSA